MRTSIAIALVVAAAAASPAARAAAPPTATPELMKQLGDGTVKLESLIDPAVGVWILDGDQATHACSAVDLLQVVAEVHLYVLGNDPAGCDNKPDAATCALPGPGNDPDSPMESFATLRFDRSARGLVLRAVVRGTDVTAVMDRAAQCTGAAATPLPTEPTPVVAAAKREKISGSRTPTVMTAAMIGKLASGAWKMAAFTDKERGLTIVDFSPHPGEPAPDPDRDERVCGRAIARELPALRARIALIVKQAKSSPDDASVSCATTPSSASCFLHEIGEYGTNLSVYFRQTNHGLVLTGFSDFDENSSPDRTHLQDEVKVARAFTRAWATPCPK